jgi:hypothetical protein
MVPAAKRLRSRARHLGLIALAIEKNEKTARTWLRNINPVDPAPLRQSFAAASYPVYFFFVTIRVHSWLKYFFTRNPGPETLNPIFNLRPSASIGGSLFF